MLSANGEGRDGVMLLAIVPIDGLIGSCKLLKIYRFHVAVNLFTSNYHYGYFSAVHP